MPNQQTIFTDDVSLQTFMDHLMKYVNPPPPPPQSHSIYLFSPFTLTSPCRLAVTGAN